jgi:transposase
MVGIDLHGNNAMLGLMDDTGRRLLHKRVPNEMPRVLEVLEPHREEIDTVAVESTFNWYWLVDGLQEANYNLVLANPAKIDQYDGLKHLDDKSEAYFLAELLRLGILPMGHIYNKETRPVRDMLRRRMGLVRQRTALMLSFKGLYTRNTGQTLGLGQLKTMGVSETREMFNHPADQLISREQLVIIKQLDQSIGRIEKAVLKVARLLPNFPRLQTIPGIGKILALTITLETGEVGRFASPGNYASYCRCVQSRRTSNEKNKGRNNGKCGNKYLAWAFVEAANFAYRYNTECRKFIDRKSAKTNGILARKALACMAAIEFLAHSE